MVRSIFFGYLAALLLATGLLLWLLPLAAAWTAPFWALAGLGLYDLRSRHNVLRIYPVIGHMRYLLEFIRPQLRQYFFESERSGRPFSREQRTIIEARSRGASDTSPFGTVHDVGAAGFDYVEHSMAPKTVPEYALRLIVGGPQCSEPYDASRFNISAMSFGSLSGNAILALNKGAALGRFFHDTGEGAISPYHLKHRGDLVWELGTGYFGCRTDKGRFDAGEFREKALGDTVKMIEIKLSQGAKPGHGGLLPAAKITPEIAKTRDIPMDRDCLSPPAHPEFSSPAGLMEFVARLRELCGGKPVGFKLCLGRRAEFMGVCKAMLETGIWPDFITVDGAEGGTGAAPLEFSDFIGAYINEALPFVHSCVAGIGLRDHIRIIASGKVSFGFDMVVKTALGADMCNAARPFMFSIGCIQARRCHTNNCPTGVTTQDPRRTLALDPEAKGLRVCHYHHQTVNAYRDMVGAMGLDNPDDLRPHHVFHRLQDGVGLPYSGVYPYLEANALLEKTPPPPFAAHWQAASADRF